MNANTQEASQVTRNRTETSQQQRFNALVEQNAGIVFKVARTYCWHHDDRVDLQQEIVLQLWTAFPKYDAEQMIRRVRLDEKTRPV